MVPPHLFRRPLSCFYLIALGALLASCGGGNSGRPDGGTVACAVVAPTVCPEPAPRYADVAPIFARHCVTCHYGALDGPWSLSDYQHIADWSDLVRAQVLTCGMPPADAAVPPVPEEDRQAILTWLLCGFRE